MIEDDKRFSVKASHRGGRGIQWTILHHEVPARPGGKTPSSGRLYHGYYRPETIRSGNAGKYSKTSATSQQHHQVVSSMIRAKAPFTADHQIRVADLARTIAKEMGLSSDKIESVRVAGSLHDLGMIGIPGRY